MLIELGLGAAEHLSQNQIQVKYYQNDQDTYELKDINEEEIKVEGFLDADIILSNIKAKLIFIKCFSRSLELNNISSETLIIEHPNVTLKNSKIKSIQINSRWNHISCVKSNETILNMNMEISDQRRSIGLSLDVYELHSKSLSINIHRRKDFHNKHSLNLSYCESDNLTLNAYGNELEVNILSCLFKHPNVHFDLNSILMNHESRRCLKINTIESFAQCIFTAEEFEELLRYKRI